MRSTMIVRRYRRMSSDGKVFPHLMLLLRCAHTYEHNKVLIKRRLVLRVLREILIDLPHENNEI